MQRSLYCKNKNKKQNTVKFNNYCSCKIITKTSLEKQNISSWKYSLTAFKWKKKNETKRHVSFRIKWTGRNQRIRSVRQVHVSRYTVKRCALRQLINHLNNFTSTPFNYSECIVVQQFSFTSLKGRGTVCNTKHNVLRLYIKLTLCKEHDGRNSVRNCSLRSKAVFEKEVTSHENIWIWERLQPWSLSS